MSFSKIYLLTTTHIFIEEKKRTTIMLDKDFCFKNK